MRHQQNNKLLKKALRIGFTITLISLIPVAFVGIGMVWWKARKEEQDDKVFRNNK